MTGGRTRTLIGLGLRLARAGSRARWITVVAGTALATTLLLVAFAVPPAVRRAAVEVTTAERVQENQLALLFALPVLAMLFTVLRLSSSTRDRRLAGLRLLGLSPRSTRVVAAVEGSATAAVGVLAGVAMYVGIAAGTVLWGWGARWLHQPLAIAPLPLAASTVLIVAVAVVVAVVPTRRISADPRGARSEASPAEPSLWRVVPLLVGIAVLVWMIGPDHQGMTDAHGSLPAWWHVLMLVGWAITGLSIPLAVPALSRALATALARQGQWLPGRLAGRRLSVEPASATRPVAGLALATYSSIIVLLFLAFITQGSGRFVLEQSYIEQGPQPITLQAESGTSAGALAPDIAALPGVRHVTPHYPVEYLADGQACTDHGYGCLPVLVGTCQDVAQLQVITGCTEDTVQLVPPPWKDPRYEHVPDQITLLSDDGKVSLPVSAQTVAIDAEATEERYFQPHHFTGLFIPLSAPGVGQVAGDPHAFAVTADGGRDVRAELSQFAAAHGMEAVAPSTDTYNNTMLGRAGLLALVAAIVGIGLLTVGVGMVDRAIERRRAVASLVVLGTPPRVLRASQLVQVLIPLTVAVIPALATGLLAAQAFLASQELEGAQLTGRIAVTDGIAQIAIPLLIGCLAVALATLPGLGARLRPQMLRKD